MSKQERDEEFFEITEQMINRANEQCDNHKNGKVSGAFTFSAARFNAFMFASTTTDLEQFNEERTLAVEYFVNQFKQDLIDNLNDYEKNYKDYIPGK